MKLGWVPAAAGGQVGEKRRKNQIGTVCGRTRSYFHAGPAGSASNGGPLFTASLPVRLFFIVTPSVAHLISKASPFVVWIVFPLISVSTGGSTAFLSPSWPMRMLCSQFTNVLPVTLARFTWK